MKAIVKITVTDSDARYAREVRFLGIPIFYLLKLNVKTKNEADGKEKN